MFACLNCKENFHSPDIFGGLHVCPFCTSRMVNTREEYQIVLQCLDEYRKKEVRPAQRQLRQDANKIYTNYIIANMM